MMAVDSSALLVCALILAALVHPSEAQVDETPYRASSMVQRYHKYTFDTTGSYFEKLAVNTALPVAIVGFFFFFVIAVWTCCRCCCKNCRVTQETSTPRFRLFVAIMVAVITLACVGMLIYGFRADQTQSDALNSVPNLVDNVVAWKDQSVAALRNLINITNLTIAEVDVVLSSPACGTIDCSQATNIRNKCQDIVNSADSITTSIANVQLASIRSKLANDVKSVDEIRHTAMVIVLAVLFTTICLQAIIALMDSRCPQKYQVREYCIGKCVTVLLTLCIIILIILIWLLAAMLLFTSVLFADLCITPATTIIRVAKITDQYTIYFLTCDQDPNLVNPLGSQLNTIDLARNLTRSSMAALNTTAQTCVGPTCPAFQTSVNRLSARVEDLFQAVGVPDSTGNANSGILGQFSCKSLNGKFQAVLNVVCGDFFLSMAQTFEVIIAFACLYVLLQVFVGLSADRMDEDGVAARPTIYGYTDVEMKPPAYAANSSSGHVMYGGGTQNI